MRKALCLLLLLVADPMEAQTVVTLSADNAAVAVPSSVTIPVGSVSTNFTISVGTVTADEIATITATLNGVSSTFQIQLVAPRKPTLLVCQPTSLSEGQSSICTVTLNLPAIAQLNVLLASSSPVLSVPGYLPIGSGVKTGSFPATASNVSKNERVTVVSAIGNVYETAVIRVKK